MAAASASAYRRDGRPRDPRGTRRQVTSAAREVAEGSLASASTNCDDEGPQRLPRDSPKACWRFDAGRAHRRGAWPPARLDELGPLAGVPVAFKDNMNLAGTHTTCSSRMLENYVSPLHGHVRRAHHRRPAASRSASSTWTSSRSAPPRRRARSAPRGTRGTSRACPAARRAAARPPVAAGLAHGHARLGHGRLHPPARQLLRHGGREAHLRRGLALRRGGVRQLARPGGPVRALGGGRGARA